MKALHFGVVLQNEQHDAALVAPPRIFRSHRPKDNIQSTIVMRGGATSAASCCSFCSTTPKCKAFTYLSGTCHMKNCNDVTLNSNGMVVEGSVSGFSIY